MVVTAAFGKYTEEAWFTVENSADVRGGDVCVVPQLRDGEYHVIFWCVACAFVEVGDTGAGGAVDFVKAGAVGVKFAAGSGRLWLVCEVKIVEAFEGGDE